MTKLIEELIAFQKSGSTKELLGDIESEIGRQNLRLVAIKILSWLRVENMRTSSRPLVLSSLPWCQFLRKSMKISVPLSDLFEIKDNKFSYNQKLPPELIAKITEMAAIGYNPPIMRR